MSKSVYPDENCVHGEYFNHSAMLRHDGLDLSTIRDQLIELDLLVSDVFLYIEDLFFKIKFGTS